MTGTTAGWLLVAACALHLGFQLTVTVLVYPGLREVAHAAWSTTHDAHTRRITPIVAVVYGLLVLASGLALVVGPRPPLLWLTPAFVLATFGTTSVAAALHGTLGHGHGHDPALVDRLLRADRLRLAFAVLAFLAGLAHAAGRVM